MRVKFTQISLASSGSMLYVGFCPTSLPHTCYRPVFDSTPPPHISFMEPFSHGVRLSVYHRGLCGRSIQTVYNFIEVERRKEKWKESMH